MRDGVVMIRAEAADSSHTPPPPPFVGGRQSLSSLRPSAGFHKLLRARGDDVIRCCPTARLHSACPHSPPVWRKEQTSDTVGMASGLGEDLLNRNNKIKCPKG